tara:strand:+ start:42 stop:362 length:321 start_codon:yes stop_codon:yes gene_type:complete
MKFLLLIFILLIGFFSFKFIFGKAKLNKNFHIYKKDLIKVNNSINSLKSKDLDKLSYSGILLIGSLILCIIPYLITFLLIFKVIGNYNFALLISSFIFTSLLFHKK